MVTLDPLCTTQNHQKLSKSTPCCPCICSSPQVGEHPQSTAITSAFKQKLVPRKGDAKSAALQRPCRKIWIHFASKGQEATIATSVPSELVEMAVCHLTSHSEDVRGVGRLSLLSNSMQRCDSCQCKSLPVCPRRHQSWPAELWPCRRTGGSPAAEQDTAARSQLPGYLLSVRC